MKRAKSIGPCARISSRISAHSRAECSRSSGCGCGKAMRITGPGGDRGVRSSPRRRPRCTLYDIRGPLGNVARMDQDPRPVALVTGAARRVGRVIAKTLHGAGYDVVLHHRASREEAGQLACELEARRAGSTLLLQGELADPAVPESLVRQAVQRFRRLDALVNNASA